MCVYMYLIIFYCCLGIIICELVGVTIAGKSKITAKRMILGNHLLQSEHLTD